MTGAIAALPAVAQQSPTDQGESEIFDATLTWGVKQSFRNYLKRPTAQGSTSVLGATTQNESSGEFTWSNGSGTITSDSSTGSIQFNNGDGVHFQGHEMDGGRKFESMAEVGPEYFLDDALLANLDLSSATINDESLSISKAPATLAAEGEEAFT